MSATTDAADLLDDAKDMLAFLRDATPPAISEGLSEASGHGLGLILQHIHDTITRARSLL